MKLLVRYKPILGESWPGYLLRLSAGNRFQGMKAIAEILDLTVPALLASSPREILPRLGIEPPADVGLNELRTGKRVSLYAAGRSIHGRVCSRCLNEATVSYIKSCWDRPFEFTCMHHHIFLLESCPSCQKPISYLRKSVDTCDCGYRFERARGRPVDFDTSQMLHVLNLREIYASRGSTFAFAGTQEMKAFLLIRRLNELSSGTSRLLRVASGKTVFLPLQAIRKALCWFEVWPEGFLRMTLLAQPGSGKTIGELIFGASQRGSKAFPTIKEALAELDRRRRTALRPKQRCVQVTANDQSEYVGIRYVINATGCTYNVAQHWISKGWLGDVTKTPTRTGQNEYRIHKSHVSKAINIINSTGSVKELSSTIGLNVGALRALARHKVLQSTPYGKGSWNVRLTPSEVFALAAQLLSVATKGYASLDRRVLVDEAVLLIAKSAPALTKPLIAALVERHIPIRYFGNAPINPGELTVKLADLEAWRQKLSERAHAA